MRNRGCIPWRYLAVYIVGYFNVCLLAESTAINVTTIQVTASYSFPITQSYTINIPILPSTPLSFKPSSTRNSHVTGLTATPSSSEKPLILSGSSISNGTIIRRRPRMTVDRSLSTFGIVMVVFGAILVTVMIICLLFICCRGRERGPEGSHTPHHSNVKMKPWKTAEMSTTNELTIDTVDTLDNINHPQSHQNTVLANTSPTLTPISNNNTMIATTESFRTLQTNTHGDLGEFGRKLSLGRQAYEPKAAPVEENTAGHEPTLEAKGEPDDLTIHFV